MSPEQHKDPVELLAGIKLFRNLNREELSIIADLLVLQNVGAAHEIFAEGDPGGIMIIISSGLVEIQKSKSHGSEKIIMARFESGSLIGEISLIDGMLRSATAVTIEPTTFYYLTQASMEFLIENEKDIAIKLLRDLAILISLRLRHTSGWFADVL